MQFLFLLASLGAGALIGWLSILAAIWFIMPIVLIGAGLMATSLDNVVRWRVAAFSVGLIVVFGFKATEFVRGVNEQQRLLKNHKVTVPTPRPGTKQGQDPRILPGNGGM